MVVEVGAGEAITPWAEIRDLGAPQDSRNGEKHVENAKHAPHERDASLSWPHIEATCHYIQAT